MVNKREPQGNVIPTSRPGSAFLLSQLGSHAGERFAAQVADLGLTPPLTGLLRAISMSPGSSQQQMATQLSLLPSRVVAFVDELETRGLVQRVRSTADRRQYALTLTSEGESMMRRIGEVALTHEQDICASLEDAEHSQLTALLARIAEHQGLTPGVHPGYRHIPEPEPRR